MDGRGTLDDAASSLGGAVVVEEVEGALDAASSLGGAVVVEEVEGALDAASSLGGADAVEEVSLGGGAKNFKSASGERREEEYL